jgi:hypothetical protein
LAGGGANGERWLFNRADSRRGFDEINEEGREAEREREGYLNQKMRMLSSAETIRTIIMRHPIRVMVECHSQNERC